MKHLNFLSKSSSQSCGHSSVTLASTVGSQEEFYVSGGNSRGAFTPADVCQTSSVRLNRFTAHRRGIMLKHVAFLLLFLFSFGVGNAWGAGSYSLSGSQFGKSNVSAYADGPTTLTGSNSSSWTVAGYGVSASTSLTIGKGGANYLQTPVCPDNITSVVVTWSGNTSYYLALQTTSGTELEAKQNPSSATEATFTISSGSYTQLRLVGRRSSGNKNAAAEITSVTVNYGSSCNSLTMSTVTATPGNGKIDLSWPAVTNASSYTVSCKVKSSGASAGTGTGSKTGTSCTISSLTNGTEYTWSVEPVGSGSYCSSNTPATGDATPNVYYNVTWKCAGSEDVVTSVANGSKPTFPPTPTSCDDESTTFVGWTNATWSGKIDDISNKTIHTSNSTMSPISGNGTIYYAVFAKASGSGTSTQAATISTSDPYISGTGWATNTAKTYSGPYLRLDADEQYVSFISPSGAISRFQFTYKLNSSTACSGHSGKAWWIGSIKFYVSTDGGSNWSELSSKSINNIDTDTGLGSDVAKDYNDLSSGGYNAIKVQFAKSCGNLGIKGLSATYSNASYSKYLTTCCNELGQINGSISWTNGTSATLSWANNSNVNSYSVTCKQGETSKGTVGSVTGTTTKSCTVTGLTAGQAYTFTITASPKSGYCDASQEISATAAKITAPASATALSGSDYAKGATTGGTPKSFTVSGVGLTGNLTVTAPSGFEVCLTQDGDYAESVELTASGSGAYNKTVTNATVWVRLASGASQGSYGPSAVTISGGGAANNTYVTIAGTVSASCHTPSISVQPAASASYNLNVTATALSVTAAKGDNADPDLTYQWYSNTANSKTTPTPTPIDGATSSSYTPLTTAAGTKYYFCEVSSGACSLTSNISAITVNTPTITVSTNTLAFGTKRNGGSYTETFTVSGEHLVGNITVTVNSTDEDRVYFSITEPSPAGPFTPTDGTVSAQTFTVTYNPTEVGTHDITPYITFTSTGADSKAVGITATSQNEDRYFTELHTTTYATYAAEGGVQKTGSYAIPVLADVAKSTGCEGLHYHFAGWVEETYKEDPSGHIVEATGNTTASNKNYYAVWEKEGTSGGSLTKMTANDDLEVGDKIVIIAQDERYGMYHTSSNSYVDYWTTTDEQGVPSLSEIEADSKRYLEVSAGTADDTWKLGDATNGYLYNPSSTNLEFSTEYASDLTLTAWNDNSFTFQAGQYISCRTDISTNGNTNKWRGASSSCVINSGSNCSGVPYYYLYKYVGVTYEDPITFCCLDLTDEIGGTVAWSGGTTATLTWDNVSNVRGTNPYGVSVSPNTNVTIGDITSAANNSCVVTVPTAGESYTFTITAYGAATFCNKEQEIVAVAPKINAVASITGLNYMQGGSCAPQSFTVSGVGLSGTITVAVPADYFEVCKTIDGEYASSVSFTPTSGTLAEQTVYVRLKSGLEINNYNGTVTISGDGAANNTSVTLAGVVSQACTTPTISVGPQGAEYNLNVAATALSVTAAKGSEGSPDLTYQWYSNNANNNTSGTIIDGATNSTYTPSTASLGTKYYYCIVYSGACFVTSNPAEVTVNTPTITIGDDKANHDFGDNAVGSENSVTISVSGTHLAKDQNIGLALSGEGKSAYALSTNSLTADNGTVSATDVTITFTAAVGLSEATLTISSNGATSKTITLNGTGKYQVAYYANGNTETPFATKLADSDGKLVLPDSDPLSCDGTYTTFIGWYSTAAGNNSSPTASISSCGTKAETTHVLTSNETYYAVFGNGGLTDDEVKKVTLDFTDNTEWEFPTDSKVIKSASYTQNGVTITMGGDVTDGWKFDETNKYFIYGKSGCTMTFSAFSYDVSKIVVTGRSEASTNTKQNIFVGSNAVSTETTGSTGTNTYLINSSYKAAGNIYTLQVTNTYNAQATKIEIYSPGKAATGFISKCCEAPETALSITSASSVATGGTVDLASTGGNGGTVTWSVVNGTGSATITGTTLTAGSVGTVTVKAHQDATGVYCAQDAEQSFTVVESTVNVDGVTVDPTSKAIVVGETFTIIPTVSPSNATDNSVSWESSATDKATVTNGGVVEGKAAGTATITCTTTDGGKTATTSVTVYGVTMQATDEDGNPIATGGPGVPSRTGASISPAANAGNYVFMEWVISGASLGSSKTTKANTITNPTGPVTVTAKYYKPLVVKWSVNGDYEVMTVVRDGAVTELPTPPTSNDCDDAKVFVGWRATAIDGTSVNDPTGIFNDKDDVPALNNAAETIFYAVFADSNEETKHLTNSEITSRHSTSNPNTGSYAAGPFTLASTDGDWYGVFATQNNNGYTVNIKSETVDLSTDDTSDKVRPYLMSPTYSKNVKTVTITAKHGAQSGTRTIYICSAATDSPENNNIGTASITNTNTAHEVTLSGSATTLYLYASNAVMISSIDVLIGTPSNFVTSCASCTAAPTFNEAPAISEIACDGATVTATNGLETLGEGEGCNIREYGFVWGTTNEPTVESNAGKHSVSENVDADVAFAYTITGLTKGTQYYVRGYAENKSGVAYSDAASFWTKDLSSIAVTTAPTKTNYIVGETFDKTGMVVTATLAGGATKDVTTDVTYSTSALTVGVDQDFTISYTLCEIEKTVKQKINVYTLTVEEGDNKSYGTATNSSANIVSVTGLGDHKTYDITVTTNNADLVDNNNGTYSVINPTGNVTVRVDYKDANQVKVYYKVNGVAVTGLTQDVYESETTTLPTATQLSTEMTAQSMSVPDATLPNFYGWSESEFGEQTTEPTIVTGTPTINAEKTYYAVFTNVSKIRIDESNITYTGYASYNDGALTSTFGEKSFTFLNVLKNSTNLQFKKASSDYGYLYNASDLSYITHVDIGASSNTDNIDVFACSAAGTEIGSALVDANTREDAYVYHMPANTSYFMIKGDNSYTYYIDYIDIYYAPAAVRYSTDFRTLTFKKLDNTSSATVMAKNHVYTIVDADVPSADGYIFHGWTGTDRQTYNVDNEVTLSDNLTLKPNVEITGDVTIPDGLGDVMVKDGKTITVSASREINDFIIEATEGHSGQVKNAENLAVSGNAYYDLTLNPSGTMNHDLWYAFAVPFPVDAATGIQRLSNDGKTANAGFNSHYVLLKYDSEERAANGKGNSWKYITKGEILMPGNFYMIALNSNVYNRVRMTKKAGATLNNKADLNLRTYSSASDLNANWNALANNALAYANVDADGGNAALKVITYDSENNSYDEFDYGDITLTVGTPFFVQTVEQGTMSVTIAATNNTTVKAPAHEVMATEEFQLRLGADTESYYDKLFVSANEDAKSEYQIGHDLAKMGVSSTIPQMYVPAYDTKLCDAEFPLVNNQASFPLTFVAPQAGTYQLYVAREARDAELYLTYEGGIIWNLSMSAYELELTKGTTEGYGLLLQAKAPGAATGVDNIDASEAAQKVIINDHVYILRNGQMYDVNGKVVK